MRNLLAFMAAVALVLGGVGWYRDWFQVQSKPSSPDTHSVEININTKKIGDDLKKGERKIIETAEQKIQEQKKAAGESPKTPDQKTTADDSAPSKPNGF